MIAMEDIGVSSRNELPVASEDMFYGLPGDIVRAVDPATEADPVGVLMSFLTLFGAAVGPSPHMTVSGQRHGANLFTVLVGDSSKSRKGTSVAFPRQIITTADPAFSSRIVGGLSSGEGLIYAVRDPVVKKGKDGTDEVVDPGSEDRRLVAIEEEFSSVIKVMRREGNTLSEVVRKAWDGRSIQTLTRNNPLRSTDPHISILGHITQDELQRVLDDTSAANGFGNRFLWHFVRRSKLLPDGGSVDQYVMRDLIDRTRGALNASRRLGEIKRTTDAADLWREMYADLSSPEPGLLGAMTARSESQTLRLSLVFALTDGAPAIDVDHLAAAIAVWDHSHASVSHIFGDQLGDPVSDRILSALRNSGPMSGTDIRDLFDRNIRGDRINRALVSLLEAKLVQRVEVETGGRPKSIWEAV